MLGSHLTHFAMGSYFLINDGGATLFVRATPGAAKNEIIGVRETGDEHPRLAVKVTAPPDKGKANQAIIKLIAKALGIPKTSLSVVNGETARLKTIAITGNGGELKAKLTVLAG